MGSPATAARAREVRLQRLAERKAASASTSPATDTPTSVEIRPQPGPQERALSCGADILIYGGAAGGGKTWALLLETLRHYKNADYGAVIFRRIYPNITNEGGLWDESKKLYPLLGGKPDNSDLRWVFPSRSRIKFSHLQYEDDVLNWKGAQIPLLCFDQLEEFTEHQFWYMLSRNRSTCGVLPYVRCTVNPVPADDPIGGWVHALIQWWLDKDTGLPILERDGLVRWFIRAHDELHWFDSKDEAILGAMDNGFTADQAMRLPKSLTFIGARLEDNKKLMDADPGYFANLMALPLVERERLHGGNWNAKPTAGKVFNRSWFEVVSVAPVDTIWVRYWDKAGTQGAGCESAGIKMGFSPTTRRYYIGHCITGQWSAHNREIVIRQTASMDGAEVRIWIEQEPGSGGKESAENTVMSLPGFIVRPDRVTGDKMTRAYPLSSMAEARAIDLVQGDWVASWLDQAHAFEEGASKKDKIDASSGAFNKLAEMVRNQFDIAGGGAVQALSTMERNGQQVDPEVLSMLQGSF